MAVLQRVQVGALLDLENLLHTARRSSGAVVRAQFVNLVDQLHTIGDLRHVSGCCDRWLAGMLAPLVAAQALAGRRTVVIGRPRSIATALRAAAHEVIELELPEIHVRAA